MPIAAVVVESYSPTRESELSISIGDTLEIISKNDDGWWLGDNGGNVGLFPSGCVAEVGEIQSSRLLGFSTITQVERKVSEETIKRLADPSVSHPSEKALAVQAFVGNSASELSFSEGDELNVLDKTKEWWVGEKGGIVGQFPSSYVSLSAIPNSGEKSQTTLSSEIKVKDTNSLEPVSKDVNQSIEKPIKKPTTLDIPFYTKPSYNTPTNTNQNGLKSAVVASESGPSSVSSDPNSVPILSDNSNPTTPTTPATSSSPTSDPVPNPVSDPTLSTAPPVIDANTATTSEPAPSHTKITPTLTPDVTPTDPAPTSAPTTSDKAPTPISITDTTPSSTLISAPSTTAPPIPEPTARPVSPVQTPISPTGSFKAAKATATPRGDVPPERPYGPPPFTIRTTAHQFKLTRSATSNTIKSPVIGSRRAPSPPRRAPPSRTSSLFAITANNRLAQRNGNASSSTIESGSKSAASAAPVAPAAAPPVFSNPTSTDSTQPIDIKQAHSEPMVAMWDYVAGSPTELTFKTGDVINVVEKNDDDGSWWQGESNGKFGHFPKNYVKPLSTESQEPEEPFLLPLGTIGQVLYDYKPLTDTELPLTKGDEIVVLEKHMKGGWSKVSHNGKVGHVPSSYLHFTEEVYPPAKLTSVGKGKALWPFEGKSDSELTFSKGDEISILKRLDGSWWLGELNGIVGHFPKTYVQDDQQSDIGITPKQDSTNTTPSSNPSTSSTSFNSTSSTSSTSSNSSSSTSSPSVATTSTASSSSNLSPTSSSSPSLSSSSSSFSLASTSVGPTPLSPRQQSRIGFERGVTPLSPQESYVTMAQVKEMIEKATEPLHKEITRLKAILLEDRFAREALQAEVAQMRERV